MKLSPNHWLNITTFILLAAFTATSATAKEEQRKVLVTATAEPGEPPEPPMPPAAAPAPKAVIIRTIESDGGPKHAKDLTWLGVSVEEVAEPLAAQLGLKTGEGLVVNYVSTDSPAAKVELKKNDVLVELDGQMLVDPAQLRKLVQMHPEGDTVKVTFYRSGKKQSVSAKLVKKAWDESSLAPSSFPEGISQLRLELNDTNWRSGLADGEKALRQVLARSGLDQGKMKIEIQRAVEQTRQAIQDAMRQTHDGQRSLASMNKELAELARGGVAVGKDATVVVKTDGKFAKTIVKTDEGGSYIIIADPHKHLTVHNQDGKLLFDGAIDSPADLEKVPKEIWAKAKPLLEQFNTDKPEDSTSPQTDSTEKQNP